VDFKRFGARSEIAAKPGRRSGDKVQFSKNKKVLPDTAGRFTRTLIVTFYSIEGKGIAENKENMFKMCS